MQFTPIAPITPITPFTPFTRAHYDGSNFSKAHRFETLMVAAPKAFRLRNFLSGREPINSAHRYRFTPYTLCKVLTDAGYAPQHVELRRSDCVSRKGAWAAHVLPFVPEYRELLIVSATLHHAT